MKLHRLTLKNFRGVRDVTVCPAETGVTVIEGRNEAGKSSLPEALNMLLTVIDRSKAQSVKNVSPADSGAGPEITAELSSGPYRFEYHKRYLSKPRTTLRIDTPQPANLNGDEAHQRVKAILDETMDAELWAALRMEQGDSHALADLSRQSALSSALDQAAAGSRGDGSDEDLFTRVEKLFFEFYTRRSNYPEGKTLKDASERVSRLERTVTELAEEKRLLDGDVDKARELSREITRQERAMKALKEEDTRARHALAKAKEQQQIVERFRAEAKLAAARRESAALALKSREGLLAQLASHTAAVTRMAEQSSAAAPALDAAREQRATTQTALAAAQQRADDAARKEQSAQAAEARLRASEELAQLDHTLRNWRQLADDLKESQRFLAACAATPDALQAARDSEARHAQLRNQAATRAPKLLVTALSPLRIEQDGNVKELATGATHRTTLGDGAALSIAEVAELRIEAGEDQAERQRAVAQSAQELDKALSALGTATIAEAEQQLRDRARHEERTRNLKQQQSTLLDGTSSDELDARIAALRATVDTAAEQADATGIREQLQQSRNERDASAQALQAKQQLLAEHTARLDTLERAELQRNAQLGAARDAIAAVEKQLADERAQAGDEHLAQQAAAAGAELEQTNARVEQASRDADAHPLTPAQQHADTARSAHEQGRARLNDCRTSLEGLHGSLSVREEKGLYEASATAATELTAARAEQDSLQRQAQAARLLYETMSAARQQQRSRYLLPLAAKMEELGRVVFGQSFRVTLDDDLAIASRTLNDITIPFEALSVGAREQMSVLQRIATALCVNEQDGVPLILDDVLGHADPVRLRAMNAVLGLAGKRTQVIVTTCYPERYRHIDRAETVVLP